MSNALSSEIAGLNQQPPIIPSSGIHGGLVRCSYGSLAIGTANQNANDLWKLTRIRSIARILEIRLDSSGLGTSCVVDLGLHTARGQVKDQDAYGASIEMAGGQPAYVVRPLEGIQDQVWQDAGDASDPGGHYDIACKVLSSSSPAAGTIYWAFYFVLP